VVSVLLPLVITHSVQNYDTHLALKNIQNRLTQEMRKNGINDYFALGSIYNSSWAFYGLLRDQRQKVGLQLHDDYRDQKGNSIKLKEYESYAFGLRIICAKDCLAKIQQMQILDWLPSPVTQTELIAASQKYVTKLGNNFDETKVIRSYNYTFKNLFNVWSEEDLLKHEQKAFPNWQTGQIVSGEATDEQNSYVLNWSYPLDLALSLPYPQELTNY